MKDNCQKIKLLKLMEMLQQDTDEFHALTTSEIIRRLGEMGISCERRTVGKDVALLREQGYEIMNELKGHENSYWIADRSFSVPELKILMDAVQAAHFIPGEKTDELIGKIAALGGSYRAELLTGNLVRFPVHKHSNQAVFYNIDTIEEGLLKKQRISFRYYDLNENKEKVYRKEGGRYQTDPVALVYDDNNYYLLGYSRKYRKVITYRVDRMDRVEVDEEPVCAAAAQMPPEKVDKFRMYAGKAQNITLRFRDGVLPMIYDKFGEETEVRRTGEDECEATVEVQLSPPFWSWLFMLQQSVQLVEPAELKKEYARKLERALENVRVPTNG